MTSDQEPPSFWKCGDCLLVNPIGAKKCEACFAEKRPNSATVKLETRFLRRKLVWNSQIMKEREEKKEELLREPYMRVIEYELTLRQKPFGFSLCKELKELFVCQVQMESLCGQLGMISGSECIAIDSFLLDSNNWSYVNKKYPDISFIHMPDLGKVGYLQSRDNLAEKPVVLRLRFDTMKALSAQSVREKENCEWWPITQKELYRANFNKQSRTYKALELLKVYARLPFEGDDMQLMYTIEPEERFEVYFLAGAFVQVRDSPKMKNGVRVGWVKMMGVDGKMTMEQIREKKSVMIGSMPPPEANPRIDRGRVDPDNPNVIIFGGPPPSLDAKTEKAPEKTQPAPQQEKTQPAQQEKTQPDAPPPS